jgi:hypothetical protein
VDAIARYEMQIGQMAQLEHRQTVEESVDGLLELGQGVVTQNSHRLIDDDSPPDAAPGDKTSIRPTKRLYRAWREDDWSVIGKLQPMGNFAPSFCCTVWESCSSD